MTHKVALAYLHGMGDQPPDFADDTFAELKSRFANHIRNVHPNNPQEELVTAGVHWAPVFANIQGTLWQRLIAGGDMDWRKARRFMVHFLGDAAGYQPNSGSTGRYEEVHRIVARGFHNLKDEAGPDAPLAVMAHSLGAMIASNYIWDLQKPNLLDPAVLAEMGVTNLASASPLEQGKTFTLFFTLGTTIPVWSLRYSNPDFGTPIAVPAPGLLPPYSTLPAGWWNFYDVDDILGYPLRELNALYQAVVTEDVEVSVGSFFTGWSPLSHTSYDEDRNVLGPIALKLAQTWRTMNGFPP